jgi:alpha-ketoglutarate-dependent taurine dioxygenase
MQTPSSQPVPIRKPETIRRKAVAVSVDELVRISAPTTNRAIPWQIQPAVEGLNVVDWATKNSTLVADLLRKHRALLFRGFHVTNASQLADFAKATSSGQLLEYRDRSTPRHAVGNKIYVSTIYPSDQTIKQHNEGTYWITWALKIYFCSIKVPTSGGQTPIADVRNVYQRVPESIRRPFLDPQIMYVRNYNDGCGLPWQQVFQTNSREEVEDYCRKNRIDFEWKDGDRLRTRQIRPAVRLHPQTGESLWFNHGAFFNISSQEPDVRESLQANFAEEDLPFNTYYGDGSRIDPDIVAQIREAYEAEKVVFDWRAGDVLLLDNMTISHGREPYAGDREVIVVMADPYSGELG